MDAENGYSGAFLYRSNLPRLLWLKKLRGKKKPLTVAGVKSLRQEFARAGRDTIIEALSQASLPSVDSPAAGKAVALG